MAWTNPTDTDALKRAAKFDQITRLRDDVRQAIARAYAPIFNAVWNDDEFVPQDVIDILGAENFLNLYQNGLTLKTLVNAEVPGTITQGAPADILLDGDGNPVVNANGGVVLLFTVTVTGPAGAVVTLTPVGGGPALPPATIGENNRATIAATAGDYTLTASLDLYGDTPVPVAVARSMTVACNLTREPEGDPS